MSISRKIILDNALRIYPNKEYCTKFEKRLFETYNEDYNKSSYEKLGELEFIVKNTSNKTILTKKLNGLLEDITKNTKNKWSSGIYNDFKLKKEFNISQQLFDDNKLEKCEFPCRNKKCRSDQCYFYTEQTRSCDEACSIFIICSRCLTRSKFN